MDNLHDELAQAKKKAGEADWRDRPSPSDASNQWQPDSGNQPGSDDWHTDHGNSNWGEAATDDGNSNWQQRDSNWWEAATDDGNSNWQERAGSDGWSHSNWGPQPTSPPQPTQVWDR